MEQNYATVTVCIVAFASHELESTNSSVNSCTGIQPTHSAEPVRFSLTERKAQIAKKRIDNQQFR